MPSVFFGLGVVNRSGAVLGNKKMAFCDPKLCRFVRAPPFRLGAHAQGRHR